MSFVDGFVAAVPVKKKQEYIKLAETMAAIFKEYGALKVVENWGVDVPEGKLTSFTMAVKREEDEAVVFSWIIWPDKKARDKAWEKAMTDPRMQHNDVMPFDGKRMIYGGFENILDD